MPLAPIVPFLPAIIGASGSVAGGLLGRKSNVGGPTPQQNALTEQQMANLKLGAGWASELFPQGKELISKGLATSQLPLDYWSRIAGGSRAESTAALAPEIQRITAGEDAARRTSMSLFPRSGGGSTYLLDSMFAPQRAISTLMQTARPAAITNLADLGSRFEDLGTRLTGQSGSLLSGSTYGAGSLQSDLLRQQEMQRRQQEDLGKSIGGILADLVKGISSRDKAPKVVDTPI